MRWTVYLEGGPRRVNHAAAAVGKLIFSFGGYCTGDNYKDRCVPIDVFVLNTDTLRWHEVSKPKPLWRREDDDEEDSFLRDEDPADNWPYQRYGHTVAAHGENIYLFGGRNDEVPCNVLYCFNTRSYKWAKPQVHGQIPAERDGHSSCIINDRMYVFGGYEETQFRFGLDVYCLDLTRMHWERLDCHGDPPIYRDFHSATAIGDRMYIFGGRSDLSGGIPGQILSAEFYTNKVHYLDTASKTWHVPTFVTPMSEHPEGRRSHSAINFDDRLLIFGGFNGDHFNDLWLMDPLERTWTRLNPPSVNPGHAPAERRRQAMCRVGEKIFLFGGTSPYSGPPIHFTQKQLSLIPEQDPGSARLIDHNDLFVLDLNPSLKTLCILAVDRYKLPTCDLPWELQREYAHMTKPNNISKSLKTLPLG